MRYGAIIFTNPDTTRINLGVSTPSRNAIVNPGFAITQRGTSFSLGINGYILDRWACFSSADGGTATTGTVSQQSFTIGQTAVPGEPQYFLRIANTNIGTNLGINSYLALGQGIEGVRTSAGGTITISFYAQSSIASKRIAIEVTQNFGTGGTPSALASVARQTFTLTTSWAKYIATFTLPSMSGKTLGTNGNDYLGIGIYLQAGGGLDVRTGQTGGLPWGGIGNTDFANIQVEKGAIATDFEWRSPGVELALCQRYLQIINASHRFIATGNNQYGSSSLYWYPMRTVPTTTNITAGTRSTNLASALIQNATTNGGRFEIRSSGTGDCYALGDRYLLDAEF